MAIGRGSYALKDASSTVTMAAADYIPQLYAKKILFDFYDSTIFKEICNTDLTF